MPRVVTQPRSDRKWNLRPVDRKSDVQQVRNYPHTSRKSVQPLPVDGGAVVCQSSCLGAQPDRVAHQPACRVVFNEQSQVQRLEAINNDWKRREVGSTSAVLRRRVVVASLVVGLVAESRVVVTASVQLTQASDEPTTTPARSVVPVNCKTVVTCAICCMQFATNCVQLF